MRYSSMRSAGTWSRSLGQHTALRAGGIGFGGMRNEVALEADSMREGNEITKRADVPGNRDGKPAATSVILALQHTRKEHTHIVLQHILSCSKLLSLPSLSLLAHFSSLTLPRFRTKQAVVR